MRSKWPPLPLGYRHPAAPFPLAVLPKTQTSDCSIDKCGYNQETHNSEEQGHPAPPINKIHSFIVLSQNHHHYIYSIQSFKMHHATIHIPSKDRVVVLQKPKQGQDLIEVELYRIFDGLKKATLYSMMNKIIKKKTKMKHTSIVYYEHVEYVKSKDISSKQIQPGEYLALTRFNQPLFKIRWKLITLKEKVRYMLTLSKAVQSLHAKGYAYLRINLSRIFSSLNGQIKITSIYDDQIAKIIANVSSPSKFQEDTLETQMRFDIWCLAIAFVQMLINGRLKVKWEQPQRTLRSIKALIKYSHHIIFYSIRTIIRKMLSYDGERISIDRVVRKLRQLSKLSQEQLVRSQRRQKKMVLPLVNSNSLSLPQQLGPSQQRIIIIDIYEVFLTFHPQEQLLLIQLTNPDLEKPLLLTNYTCKSLPQNIRAKHKSISCFFQYLQHLDPACFRLTREGGLHIMHS